MNIEKKIWHVIEGDSKKVEDYMNRLAEMAEFDILRVHTQMWDESFQLSPSTKWYVVLQVHRWIKSPTHNHEKKKRKQR